MKPYFSLIVSLLFLTTPAAADVIPKPGLPLIISSYENSAWGYQYSETFIDTNGNVYAFRNVGDKEHYEMPFGGRRPDTIEYYEWLVTHSDFKYMGKLDEEKMDELKRLIELASDGPVIRIKHNMSDFGASVKVAFNSKRHAFLLGSISNICKEENKSESAQILIKMFGQIIRDLRER